MRRKRAASARIAATCLVFLSGAVVASPAGASDQSEGWVPSFSLYFDALGQKMSGAVTTSAVLGPPRISGCINTRNGTVFGPQDPDTGLYPPCASSRPIPEKLLVDVSGTDTSISPLVGTSLELMSPSFNEGPVRLRAFGHADFAVAFAFERTVAALENPNGLRFPLIFISQNDDPNRQQLDELSILGQGSRATLQVEDFIWSAGAGLSFGFDVGDWHARLKPSFEYLTQEITARGKMARAIKLQHPTVSIADFRNFRLVSFQDEETERYHGIGGGLELEVDTAPVGPFATSVFLSGRALYLVSGELRPRLSATDQGRGDYGEWATWSFKVEPIVWRTGVGIRFRWAPEAD